MLITVVHGLPCILALRTNVKLVFLSIAANNVVLGQRALVTVSLFIIDPGFEYDTVIERIKLQ